MLCIPFNLIPLPIRLNFLGGPIAAQACLYVLIASYIFTFIYRKNYPLISELKYFFLWTLAYLTIMFMIQLNGFLRFPYWDFAINSSLDYVPKLKMLMLLLKEHNILASERFLFKVWIFVRQIKEVLWEVVWCFGGSCLVYIWWRNDLDNGIKIFIKAVLASCFLLFIYSFIEINYLLGSKFAENILIGINPFLHAIKTNQNWWPPLLWPHQLRMVFPEPSHVGNYVAFALPILIYDFFKSQSKITGCSIVILSFLAFLSKARTAYGIICVVMLLMCFLVLIGKHPQIKRIKSTIIVLGFVVIGFCGYWTLENTYYMSISHKPNASISAQTNASISAQNLLNENLGTLTSQNRRSNGARYALIKSNLRVFSSHPLLGVGRGLTGEYISHSFAQSEREDREVSQWISNESEKGPFAPGYSLGTALNEYVTRLTQTGIIGTLIFFAPFIFIIIKLFQLYRQSENQYSLECLFALESILASLFAVLNGSLTTIYGSWIILGLAYVIVYNGQKRLKSRTSDR